MATNSHNQLLKRKMARTAQTARRVGAPASNGVVVDNPELDEVAAAKLKALESGDMMPELKHIDRKVTDKGVGSR